MIIGTYDKERNGVVGWTCGAFDLTHSGHFLMFKEAKRVCDYLVVGLHSDPTIDRPQKNKPILSLNERKEILEGIKYIDEVFIYDTEKDLYRILKNLKPDIRIIGADWKGKPFTGHDLKIKTYFNSRDHSFSTTELRNRIYEAERAKRKD